MKMDKIVLYKSSFDKITTLHLGIYILIGMILFLRQAAICQQNILTKKVSMYIVFSDSAYTYPGEGDLFKWLKLTTNCCFANCAPLR